ncbi:transposase [uncultured Nostoc sp.]|uniref:transposase n=1 Tax=uncultured Nostoc sp. TaxID=340711 RepID=UPI0026191DEE|nr:transposase [uncultured Nostoc sp.]
MAVDTLGLPFFTHCTKASMSDDGGLIELLTQNLEYFRAKPVNIPKITILHGRRLPPRQNHNCSANTLPSDNDQDPIPTGTQTHKSRNCNPRHCRLCSDRLRRAGTPSQLVGGRERSNAWMERCKSLVKNFERTLAHATAKLNLCFIRLMLKRLAQA